MQRWLSILAIGFLFQTAAPADVSWTAISPDAGHKGKLRRATINFSHVGPLLVTVYLPPHYSESHKYPVLYVMDGHKLFDGKAGTWSLDETLEEFCNAKKIQEIIVVGIHMNEQANHKPFGRDYWLEPVETVSPASHKPEGGHAKDFLADLLQTKSVIDHTFSTDPNNTGLMGSSLGGLFTLYAGFKRSDIFHKLAVSSPSLFLSHRDIQHPGETWIPAHNPWPMKIWMDFGTDESDSPQDSARQYGFALQQAHWFDAQPQTQHMSFRFTPYDQKSGAAQHTEDSWAVRVRQSLPWLYPPNGH